MANTTNGYGERHPLLLYRFVSWRYRPAGVLLMVLGAVLFASNFFPSLRPANFFLSTEALVVLSVVSFTLGVLVWITAVFEKRHAWVQCQPDFLVINTSAGKVAVAYRRVNTIKTVKLGELFPKRGLRGRDKGFIRPLLGELALEVVLREYPIPEEEIRRRISRFMFSPRDTGFIFVVPRPADLKLEINTAQNNLREAERAEQNRYIDPMARGGRF
jgi:hypothetical protein